MIYFTAHTFKCVCHCRRAMIRVLGMYNFDLTVNRAMSPSGLSWIINKIVSVKGQSTCLPNNLNYQTISQNCWLFL